jgi:hypothetical protein
MSTSLPPLPGSSNNFTTRGPTRSEVKVKPSSNVYLRVHSPTPWFEPSRVRTLIYACMHVHPWFESLRSTNVSITWGARTHSSRTGVRTATVIGSSDAGVYSRDSSLRITVADRSAPTLGTA